MRIELSYGREGLEIELPDDLEVQVIRKPAMPVIERPEEAVAEALANPVGTAALRESARGRRSACILICDVTRPVPNALFLRPMIETLIGAGVPKDGITVLVATGLHRPNEGDELAEVVGDPWVIQNVRVENHFARDDAMHVDLGFTPNRKVPVKIDRRFIEADLKIATGLVEPHFMAGYSGGRKVIAPGVAHKDTITTFHSARFMEDPKAANCVLEGNPLHEEQVAIAGMIGGVMALNTVIDEDRRLSFVNFGEIVQSHLQAVAHIDAYARVPVRRQFQTVVTTAAGHPLDKTYYQTVKGMVGPLDIMAEGGELIIASACSEGMGSAEFIDAQRRLVQNGAERFLEEILKKRFADIDEWQTEMQLKPMRIGKVKMFTQGLDDATRPLTGVDLVSSVEAAVIASVERSGDRHVAIIPEGPYVVPSYQPA
ncbi:MAG: nickel-dependent lactate racemase [Geminicoccaceae bacterium]|nr:nickel-dependent lactate racemase [Geminicoccaceae bacterium]